MRNNSEMRMRTHSYRGGFGGGNVGGGSGFKENMNGGGGGGSFNRIGGASSGGNGGGGVNTGCGGSGDFIREGNVQSGAGSSDGARGNVQSGAVDVTMIQEILKLNCVGRLGFGSLSLTAYEQQQKEKYLENKKQNEGAKEYSSSDDVSFVNILHKKDFAADVSIQSVTREVDEFES
jgi:hypothetical protein